MTNESSESLHAFVHGRVQGVGFRAFVVYHAQAIGLRGFARNLADGRSVEVQAEGPRDALEALLALLKDGPSASRVERVDATWGAAPGGFESFGVR